MSPTLRRRILEALEAAAGEADVAGAAAGLLDSETRDQIVREYVAAVRNRSTRDSTDPRQYWLDLGLARFSHVLVQGTESLEQYREGTEKIAARIKSYGYARRSSEKLERDKKELRERLRLDPKIATYFAGDSSMTMDRAIELLAAEQKSARIEARRKGGRAKAARTKNQQLEHTEK